MSVAILPAQPEIIRLSGKEPFGVGGRRSCYTHPDDPGKCVKVLRTDARRTIRGSYTSAYFKDYRAKYDNNADEKPILEKLYRRLGPVMREHLPRCYGTFLTDLGPGLVLDLIRDDDGQISRSIRELVSTGTPLITFKAAYDQFGQFLLEHRVLTRQLLDHNLVARRLSNGGWQLYLIDGFGDPAWIPLSRWIPPWAKQRIRSRIERAWPRMEKFAATGGVTEEMLESSSWDQGFLRHRGD